MTGETFEYCVVAYGATAEIALKDAIAWQTRRGLNGAGCAVYKRRTVPVEFGQPYRPDWLPVWTLEWRVPVTWMVTDEPLIEDEPADPVRYLHGERVQA